MVTPTDKLSFLSTGGKRVLGINEITIIEDEVHIEIINGVSNMSELIINVDANGQVDSRIYRSGDTTYIFCNGELIRAFKNDSIEQVDIDLSEIDLEKLSARIVKLTFGASSDDNVLEELAELKLKLINAIKSIKGDVIIDGLSRRLDIALSMINTNKKLPGVDGKELKKSKK